MNKDIRATDKEPLLAGQSGPAGSGSDNQPVENDLDTQPNNCRKYFDRFVKNLTILVVMVAYVVFLGALGYTGWQMYLHYQQKYQKNYEGSKDRMLVHQMAQFYFNDKFFYNMHSFVSRTKHIKRTVHDVGDAFGDLQKLSGLASTVIKARSEIPVGLKIQVLNKEPEDQTKQSAPKRVLAGEAGKAIKINIETKAKTPEVKPAETKPTESKPAESKPAETKPTETKPAENKPSEAKHTEAKPVEAKPAETKPADTHPADSKPAESKPTDGKPSFLKANEESSTTSEEKPKPVPPPDYPKLYREFCDQMSEKEPEIEKLDTLVADGKDMLTKIGSLVTGLTGFTENLLSTRKTLDQQINQYLFDNELTSIYTMTDQDVWLLGWLLYSKKMVEDWQIKPRDMIGSAKNYEKLNMTDFLIVKDYLDDLVAQVHKKVISNDHSLADFGFNIARGLFFNITSLNNITNCTNGKLVCPCAEGQTSKPEAYCQEKPKPLVQKKVVNLTDPDAPEPEPPEEQEPVKVDESSVDVITPYTALKSLEKNYFEEPDLRSFGVAFKFIMGRYYSKELGGVPPVKK